MTVPTPPSTTLSTPSPTERSNPLDTDSRTDSHPDPMASRTRPIYLIVATTASRTSISSPSASTRTRARLGIGFKNALPWPQIKADMGFFMRVTRDSRAPSAGSSWSPSMNAVIMGRKTYESIPSKFRPLAGRLNVVVSRKSPREVVRRIEEEIMREHGKGDGPRLHFEGHGLAGSEEGGENVLLLQKSNAAESVLKRRLEAAPVLVSSSVDAALEILTQTPGSTAESGMTTFPTSTPHPPKNPLTEKLQSQISNIFIIGGAEIYSSFLANTTAAVPDQPFASNQPTASYQPPDSTQTIGPIRILQTTIQKLNGGEFECDTYFPVNLTSRSESQGVNRDAKDENDNDNNDGDGGGNDKSSGSQWNLVSEETAQRWLANEDGTPIPLPQAQGAEGSWIRDEKVGVELKVLGWQKSIAKSQVSE